VRKDRSGMDWIGDAHSFVLPGFWDSRAVLVALVVACDALLVEFPLYLRFLVETFSQEIWLDCLTDTS
jgi:hypothetical protein